MDLITTDDILSDAKDKKYAIAAFNIENMEMCKAVLDVANEYKSPVILQTSKNTLKFNSPLVYASLVKSQLKPLNIPVSLHLDHGDSKELVGQCLIAGYSSIMIDGSKLDYADNIELTKSVSDLCKPFGVPVEGELGAIGGKIGDTNLDLAYTKPETAVDFLEKTGIQSLAVAIGTAHGVYAVEPKLDIGRLKNIRDSVSAPLVLHGASGISDENLRNCIQNGICKINFATELRIAYSKAVAEYLKENSSVYDPKKYGLAAMESVKEVVRQKLRVCNSIGRAFFSSPKAIIFDFDGVIVDSEKIYFEMWKKAAEHFGLQLNQDQLLNLRSLDSQLAREFFFTLTGNFDTYDKVRELRKTYMSEWLSQNSYEVKPYIAQNLEYLHSNGYKLYIASASDVDSVKKNLTSLNLMSFFEDIISVKDVGRGKPYPDIYNYIAKKLNCLEKELLVFEDSPNGVMSASAAGCKVVMIPDLSKPDDELIKHVDLVIPDASFIGNFL